MTQLAEKQTQSIDTLQNNDQFELAKLRTVEQRSATPRFTYEQNEIDQDNDSISGNVYLKNGDDEYNAVGFTLDKEGELMWYDKQEKGVHDDKDANAVSIVIARQDGSIERLGSDRTSGLIKDFSAKDQLYIVHDATINILSKRSEMTKDDLDMVIEQADITDDVVRLSLDESAEPELTSQPKAVVKPSNFDNAARRKKAEAEKAQRAEAINANNNAAARPKAPVSKLQARMDLVAARDAATDPAAVNVDALPIAPVVPKAVSAPATTTANRSRIPQFNDRQMDAADAWVERHNGGSKDAPTAVLNQVNVARTSHEDGGPLMEHIRLARNVEKYTDKVASYEEIAAEALAKRMKGRLFKPLRRKSQEEAEKFDDTMSKLDRFTMALDNSLMKQMILEGKTDEEAAELLAAHQQARAEARAERNRAELTKGRVASWLDKYANLSTKKKIIFGIGAGAVIAAAGAGLAAAGGVAAVAGGVGLAAIKVGKTYAQKRSEIYKVDKDQVLSPDTEVTDEDGNTTKRSVREQVIAARDHHRDQRETSIHKADRNKKLAVGLATVAGVALGAGIVTKAIEHGDEIRGIIDKKIYFGNPGGPEHADGGSVPKVVETPERKLPPKVIEHDFTPFAKTIDLGEGWLQTFNEAGIANVNEQYALLNNQTLMQELADKGLAYRDANIGGWGINMTADGKMPADALKLITDFARRDGYDLAS